MGTTFRKRCNTSDANAISTYTATNAAADCVGVEVIYVNHATVAAVVTLTAAAAVSLKNRALFIKNISASGTAAHRVVLPSGYTFDGTNRFATLDAPNEALFVWIDSAGNGTVLENVGTVGLATS